MKSYNFRTKKKKYKTKMDRIKIYMRNGYNILYNIPETGKKRQVEKTLRLKF